MRYTVIILLAAPFLAFGAERPRRTKSTLKPLPPPPPPSTVTRRKSVKPTAGRSATPLARPPTTELKNEPIGSAGSVAATPPSKRSKRMPQAVEDPKLRAARLLAVQRSAGDWTLVMPYTDLLPSSLNFRPSDDGEYFARITIDKTRYGDVPLIAAQIEPFAFKLKFDCEVEVNCEVERLIVRRGVWMVSDDHKWLRLHYRMEDGTQHVWVYGRPPEQYDMFAETLAKTMRDEQEEDEKKSIK